MIHTKWEKERGEMYFFFKWDFNFQLSHQSIKLEILFLSVNVTCSETSHRTAKYSTSLFCPLLSHILHFIGKSSVSFFDFNFTVRHVTPEQMKAFKYYKKNSMSVELLKDNNVQKCHFRVKNKVRKSWYTASHSLSNLLIFCLS